METNWAKEVMELKSKGTAECGQSQVNTGVFSHEIVYTRAWEFVDSVTCTQPHGICRVMCSFSLDR